MSLQHSFSKNLIEAGCDEAGRGCLAGPVYAAAVILPPKFYDGRLNDSKKITKKTREELRKVIEEKALAWAVGIVTHQEIDKINILNASFLAMHRAIDQLAKTPELLLIDGNRFKPYLGIAHQCIIKGDSKFASIAAASVLAKTHRDEYMQQINMEYPHFEWHKNQGYPTKKHRAAIKLHGACKYHRASFKLLAD